MKKFMFYSLILMVGYISTGIFAEVCAGKDPEYPTQTVIQRKDKVVTTTLINLDGSERTVGCIIQCIDSSNKNCEWVYNLTGEC